MAHWETYKDLTKFQRHEGSHWLLQKHAGETANGPEIYKDGFWKKKAKLQIFASLPLATNYKYTFDKGLTRFIMSLPHQEMFIRGTFPEVNLKIK